MPHLYEQSTGRWFGDNAERWGIGWSGREDGFNNPLLQDHATLGPLPEGWYTIGPAHEHPRLGPVTMDLLPDPTNEMFGRQDFRIHGFSKANEKESSHGCVIQIRPVRERIDLSSDRRLRVVKWIPVNANFSDLLRQPEPLPTPPPPTRPTA